MIQALIGPATKLLGKFIEDKDTKNKLAHELATMAERHAQELAKSQIEVNKAEAQSRHWFVASWRPFIGWTCGIALMWHFVLSQFILFFATMFGFDLPALPEFDMGSLMTVLMGMLGLGGLRTFEKYKGMTK
jgi:phenylpyruvate tautomerase PptA (4-oxalocrotonate tautomerase family)|tara:strand:+ start:321 stop:716 length:396 start_codon:yes stop_codon:yes gene_type:complete